MFRKDGITYSCWQEYNLIAHLDRDLKKQRRSDQSRKNNLHKDSSQTHSERSFKN